MPGPTEVPTPQFVCKAEGHFATCPGCQGEFEVLVTERENPNAKFVLSRKLDSTQQPPVWIEDEVAYGTVAVYDLSAYEAHYREAH